MALRAHMGRIKSGIKHRIITFLKSIQGNWFTLSGNYRTIISLLFCFCITATDITVEPPNSGHGILRGIIPIAEVLASHTAQL